MRRQENTVGFCSHLVPVEPLIFRDIQKGGTRPPASVCPPAPSSRCSPKAQGLVASTICSREHWNRLTEAMKSFLHPFVLLKPPKALSTCPLSANDLASYSTGKTEESQRGLPSPPNPRYGPLCLLPATLEEDSLLLQMRVPPWDSGTNPLALSSFLKKTF